MAREIPGARLLVLEDAATAIPDTAAAAVEKKAESARTTTMPVAPIARTALTASAISEAAPFAELAEPLRRRDATITGTATGVEAVTIWKCRPLTLVYPCSAPCLAAP